MEYGYIIDEEMPNRPSTLETQMQNVNSGADERDGSSQLLLSKHKSGNPFSIHASTHIPSHIRENKVPEGGEVPTLPRYRSRHLSDPTSLLEVHCGYP